MFSLLLAFALLAPASSHPAQVTTTGPSALCRAYYGLENWDRAISECEHAIALNPSSENHDWLARAYGAKAEHSSWFSAISLAKKVRSEFEKAVAADPANVIARRDLAEFYVEAPSFLGGGKDKAEQQAAQLGSINRADALYIRARLAESGKDNARAESLYKQSVEASKEPAQELSELAAFYRRSGSFEQMQTTVARIALLGERNPGTPLFDSAAMLIRTGRDLPQAVSMLKRFIAAGGTEEAPLHQAYYQLGLAYQKQGNTAAATSQFKQSTEIANYAPAEKALKSK